MTRWVDELCGVPLTLRAGGVSVAALMERVRPYLTDRDAFVAAVREALRGRPELVDAWQGYSVDKRTGRGPYFGRGPNPWEVGFYDDGFHDVRAHTDPVEGCADFIYREVAWVLNRARATTEDGQAR